MATRTTTQADGVAASFVAAQAFRRGQLQVRAAYLREFADLWPVLAQERDVDRWLRLNVALVRRWQTPARSAALRFFEEQQAAQGVRVTRPVQPDPMPTQQIVRNLVDRGPRVARKARLVGLDELEAWRKAEAAAMGSGGRMVLSGGRDALEAQSAVGWMRVTDGDPCAFCAMNASRGAVYSSSESAGREANTKFVGAGSFKFHDDCGCTAMPVFSRTDFMSPEAMKYRELWNATYGESGVTDAGNEVRSLAYFRAVIEGRAPSPVG